MEVFLVLGATLAIVWGAVLVRAGGLLALCLLVMLAGCCFSSEFYSVALSPLPLTVDRLLIAVLLCVYAVYRRFGWTDPKPLRAADTLLLAFIGVLLASTLTHDWQADSSRPLGQVILYYLMPLAIYWVARQQALTKRGLVAMLVCLSVFGLYLSITAIAETHQAWWLVFPRYIVDSKYTEFLGRGRGPFLNPTSCGIFLGVGLASTFMAWPRLDRLGRLLLLLLVAIFAWGVYSTLTRSAWFGALLGLLIVAGLSAPRHRRVPLVVGTMLLVLALGAANWERLLMFQRDTGRSAEETADSARLRPILATVSWKMFLDRPLLGCGYGQYFHEKNAYLSDRSVDLPLERARPYVQHNVFLSLVTETGLVGAGLFVILLTLWCRDAWRLWHSPSLPLAIRQCGLLFLALMANYVVNGMFHDVAIASMANMLLFFQAGTVQALAPLTARQPEGSVPVVWTWSSRSASQPLA